VGQPHQRAINLGGAHQLCFFACAKHGFDLRKIAGSLTVAAQDERNISKPFEPLANSFRETINVVGLLEHADRENVVVAFLQIGLQFVS
jgi:hypothetical protein